jgi:hypothetical protein
MPFPRLLSAFCKYVTAVFYQNCSPMSVQSLVSLRRIEKVSSLQSSGAFLTRDVIVPGHRRGVLCPPHGATIPDHRIPVLHRYMAPRSPVRQHQHQRYTVSRLHPKTQVCSRRSDAPIPAGRAFAYLWKTGVGQNSAIARCVPVLSTSHARVAHTAVALLGEADVLSGQMMCPRSPPNSLAAFADVHPTKENWVVQGICAYVPQVHSQLPNHATRPHSIL